MAPTPQDLIVEQRIQNIFDRYSQEEIPFNPLNFRTAICEIAEAFEGIREVGKTNSGFWVDKFLKETHLNPGYAWCMAYVQYVYRLASQLFYKPDLLPKDSAGTQIMAQWAMNNNLGMLDFQSINKGDIIIWRNHSKSDKGHTGLILEVIPKPFNIQRIRVAEGNTTRIGWGREGGWLAFKEYSISELGKLGDEGQLPNQRYVRAVISATRLVEKFNV